MTNLDITDMRQIEPKEREVMVVFKLDGKIRSIATQFTGDKKIDSRKLRSLILATDKTFKSLGYELEKVL